MDIKQKIGIALRDARLKNRLSQKELSERTGIDRTFISHIELGGRNVSIETLETLLNGMSIPMQKFFSHEAFSKKPV